ncbi:MAG: hypothetical protein JWR61_509 [Ferruginibacter sp.]|nr:hypothetical protein [Ferruginibacter sp.]
MIEKKLFKVAGKMLKTQFLFSRPALFIKKNDLKPYIFCICTKAG